jgi:hypothetical protein
MIGRLKPAVSVIEVRPQLALKLCAVAAGPKEHDDADDDDGKAVKKRLHHVAYSSLRHFFAHVRLSIQ